MSLTSLLKYIPAPTKRLHPPALSERIGDRRVLQLSLQSTLITAFVAQAIGTVGLVNGLVHPKWDDFCVLGGAVAGLTVAIAIVLSRGLVHPMLRFTRSAQAMAEGELAQIDHLKWNLPVQVKELEMLAATFNRLAQRGQQSVEALAQVNEELELRVEERMAELRFKNNITTQIRTSLDLDQIVQTAVAEIQDLLQVDRCMFAEYYAELDPPAWEVIAEAKIESIKSVLGYYPAKSLGWIGENLLRCKVVQIDDIQKLNDPLVDRLLIPLDSVSLLALPIHLYDDVVGVIICTHSAEVRHWKTEEVEFLRSVVDQLAIAIGQAQLYIEARNNAQDAQTQALRFAEAMRELQQTQAKLVQTEKMSSLGQMVAGIAHEINNPVNFIYGNLIHAENYGKSLLNLVRLYEREYSAPSDEILDTIDEIDLAFLEEDSTKLFESMQAGAERIREIVESLRNFSRLDEADFKMVDVHEGLDSTLMILENRLKATRNRSVITITKRYSEIPKVKCYPGQLNQVFMHILSNAIDAVEESKAETPNITIKTQEIDADWIAISIIDNGQGMSEETRSKLFDPFFTTKPIGKGTGLGLSISYQIITDCHQGQIECTSELNVGTEFVIKLPIAPQEKPESAIKPSY